MRNSFIFGDLDDNQMNVIIDAMEEEEVMTDDEVELTKPCKY